VVDHLGVARDQAVAEVEHLAVHGERLQGPTRRVEDGAARRLVDAARLHADDAVLHEVHASDAVLTAHPVEAREQGHRAQALAVDRHRIAPLKVDEDLDGHVGRGLRRVREQKHLIGRGHPRVFQDAALVRDVEEVAVGGVRPLGGHRDRDVVPAGELQQRRAGGELPLPPGGDDPELGGQRRVGQLEAHLVVALAGGAVGHRVGAFPERDLHLRLGDAGARDRGAQQVRALVDGVGPEHGKDEVPDELLLEVHDVDPAGPGPQRLLADGQQLLALAQIGAVGDDLAVVALDQPAQDHGGVEPARIREDDALGVRHRRGTRPAGSG
jgi:hypothetical protein